MVALAGLALFTTKIAHAQIAQQQSIGGIIKLIMQLLNLAVPILTTVIVIFIAVAGVQYAKDSDGGLKSKHREQMIAGVIALAIIFSIFGIIRVLQNTVFGGSVNNDPTGQNLETPSVFLIP